jgi:putative flavoprotein involved in K+ transport
MNGGEPVVIAGGGAGGLSVAAMLDARGIRSTVLERAEDVGTSWANRYESLRLNTPRFTSTLARYRMPRRYGRWPTRNDVVEYLRDYADKLRLVVRTGTEVRRVDRDAGGWRVQTSDGGLRAPCVVIATGHDREPFIPGWPGRDEFAGDLMHAVDYRDPEPFRGKDVLIVSAANTGTEIAYELSRNGVGRVRNAMRSVPPVFPREWLGWPLNYTATFLDLFPDALGDGVTRATQRVIYGDLSPYGIPRSTYGVQTLARRRHRSPLIDAGYVEALKGGEVELVPAVVGFDGPDVLLADGERIQPEVVIVATGYRTGLEPIVGHLGVLDERGYPQVRRGSDSPKALGLFFTGYWATMSGQLRHMRRDARKIARAIARRLQRPSA